MEAISKFQKRIWDVGSSIEPLDDRKRKPFLEELKDGEVFYEILQTADNARSYLQNRYYWGGVLSEFVPAHFQTAEAAHEFFTNEFLRHIDVFDEDETDRMQKALSKARKIVSNRIYHTFCGNDMSTKMEIVWIQSTASLTTKEFNQYIEQIKVRAADYGLQIKEPEEYAEIQ